MRSLCYLFYRILHRKQADKRERSPLHVATMSVAVLLYLNVLSLLLLSELATHRLWLTTIGRGPRSSLALIVGIALYLIVQRLCVNRNGSVYNEKAFTSESPMDHQRRTILMWCYIFVTVAAPIVLVVIISNKGPV
jgi:hypothetical protein